MKENEENEERSIEEANKVSRKYQPLAEKYQHLEDQRNIINGEIS